MRGSRRGKPSARTPAPARFCRRLWVRSGTDSGVRGPRPRLRCASVPGDRFSARCGSRCLRCKAGLASGRCADAAPGPDFPACSTDGTFFEAQPLGVGTFCRPQYRLLPVLDPAACTIQAINTPGIAARSPTRQTVDIRWEAFNIFNTVNFQNQQTTVGNTNFGLSRPLAIRASCSWQSGSVSKDDRSATNPAALPKAVHAKSTRRASAFMPPAAPCTPQSHDFRFY